MAVSPKVSASTVGAAASTVVVQVLAKHLFHGAVPSDVLGLIEGAVTAGVTFASGYFVAHAPKTVAEVETAVKDVAEAIPFTQMPQLPLENPQPTAQPLPPAGA
jgi:hypothetical protein